MAPDRQVLVPHAVLLFISDINTLTTVNGKAWQILFILKIEEVINIFYFPVLYLSDENRDLQLNHLIYM